MSVHPAEDFDDPAPSYRICGAVDNQGGQVLAQGAAGALAAPVDLAFSAAGSALASMLVPNARC